MTMHYPKMVTLLIVITEFVSAFHKFDINRLLLRINRSQFNITNIRENWMDQRLDHYDKSDRRTLKMRYFENDSLWKQNGPVFIFICGENELNPDWIATSSKTLIGQLAEDTNGAMFAPEHRYYGKSLPSIMKTNDFNYHKFLSSRQALADFEEFVKIKIKSQPKYKKSKVVVIGGSYGGNLAAWLRKLYPELVDAAVASSAPVRAKADFSKYLDILSDTLRKYGTEDCNDKIKRIYNSYTNLLMSGIKMLKKKLNICKNSDLEVPENQRYLIYLQNIKLMTKFTEIRTPNDVIDMCKNIENIFEPSRYMPCTDIDYFSVKYETPWFYQLCNEFGYFQTTSSDGSKNIFGNWNSLEFYAQFCKYLIKGDTTKNMLNRIKATNRRYGGRNPKVTKVVFSHGDMDPWKNLGVKKTNKFYYYVKTVERTSHCAVLNEYDGEPKELTKHREYVKNLIKRWILPRKYEDFRLDSNLNHTSTATAPRRLSSSL